MLFNNFYSDINFPQLLLSNKILEKVNEFKLLGIIVQNNLQWTSHIQAISIKIARNIGILLSIKNCVPTETLTLLSNSNIQYGHCHNLWGTTFDSHLNPILTLQKKASTYPLVQSKPPALKLRTLLSNELYCCYVGILCITFTIKC